MEERSFVRRKVALQATLFLIPCAIVSSEIRKQRFLRAKTSAVGCQSALGMEETMKKGLTEIVFILDRSGSMSGLEADTIGGYNSLMERQKKEEGEAYISTVLFDDVCEVLHDRVSLDSIQPMTDKE